MKGHFFLPMEAVTEPRSGRCIVGWWWAVHPEKGVAFFRRSPQSDYIAPQCNPDRACSEAITKKILPECEVVCIPVVYMANVESLAATEAQS